MPDFKKIFLVIAAFTGNIAAFSQSNIDSGAKANTLMTSNGKLYVVMTVVITILAGLILYVFRLDNKIKKLEKGRLD